MSWVFCPDIALVSISIHPPRGFGSTDSLSADRRDMGAHPKRLRGAQPRDHQSNYFRLAYYGCGPTPHNACWFASLPPKRRHDRRREVPLEAGKEWRPTARSDRSSAPHVQGSNLALLGNHR